MDLNAVTAALADCAATVQIDLPMNTYPFTPDSISEPCFFIAEVEVDYDTAMNRALDTVTLTGRVLVGRADADSSATRMNSLLAGSGATSLKAALESGRGAPGEAALDGAADDYRVTRFQAHRFYEHAGTTYLGGELTIRVIGPGETA